MVLFIVVYVLYFSWLGQRYFAGTKEGVQYFSTFGDSCFNMLVLMTTSNYPDVMLPAYQINRNDCIFFLIYLVLGLFLLMNLLLAIFYSRFKDKLDQNLTDKSKWFYNQFLEMGNEVHPPEKDYLTKKQTYKLFMMIHGLVKFKEQKITDEEIEEGFSDQNMATSMRQTTEPRKKRDITCKEFDYIYKRKIQKKLKDPNRFKFENMNLIIEAYEFWKYENIVHFEHDVEDHDWQDE